jgi:5-hydroxyisourate hydrolase
MSGISTHVLDTSVGLPAQGIKVQLFFEGQEIAASVTDQDGRISTLLPPGVLLRAGVYQVVFAVGSRWADSFYPEVSVTFVVKEVATHYHVPLLISPYGFTTYRGS